MLANLRWIKKPLVRSLCCSFLLLSACANPSNPTAPQGFADLNAAVSSPLAYATFPMAWDGENLWQYVIEENSHRLLQQNPVSQTGRNIILKTDRIPQHRSMSFGREQLWLLDNQNTIYQLSQNGDLINSLALQEMPAVFGAEALAWSGDELWVLHKTYLSAENKIEASRLFQIDPANGKILKTLILEEVTLSGFSHTNLYATDSAFYLARTSIFNASENVLYTVSKADGTVKSAPFNFQLTGLPTLFEKDGTYYGIELAEFEQSCNNSCAGRLIQLPEISP